MAFNEEGTVCANSAVDLFTPALRQGTAEKRERIAFGAGSDITDSPQLTFYIKGSESAYTDLASHCLQITGKVTADDGTNLPATAKVGPTNYFLHSLISDLKLYANETLITESSDNYQYRAYFENTLSYSKAAKECQFANVIYAKDDAGKYDKNDPTAATAADKNKGLITRRTEIASSRTFKLRGRLHSDFLTQGRYLLNNVDLKLVLTLSPLGFALIGDDSDKYKISLSHAEFQVDRVHINPTILLHHEKLLNDGEFANYPLRSSIIKTFDISTGDLQVAKENLFQGRKPRRVIIALVDASAASGDITKNPYNFQHCNLKELALQFDTQRFPTEPLKMNFTKNDYGEAYDNLLTAIGIKNDDTSIDITKEDFKSGQAIYAVSLTADDPECEAFDFLKTGALKLKLDFDTGLAQTTRCITYAEFEKTLRIDKDRNISWL